MLFKVLIGNLCSARRRHCLHKQL